MGGQTPSKNIFILLVKSKNKSIKGLHTLLVVKGDKMKNRMNWIRIVLVFFVIVSLILLKDLQSQVKNAQENPSMIGIFAEEYDVIVIGGEPEGVAAAVSAARNNAKTLLIEKRAELGGLFTYGMLNYLDIPQGEDGQSVSRGIFTEWHQLVGGKSTFGISEAKTAFKKLINEEENITFLSETEILEPIVKNNKITAVKIRNKLGEYIVKGKAFIDATQDADLTAMAKAPYFIGAEDIGLTNRKMSATIMIHLQKVDWEKIKQTAISEKFGAAVVTDSVAWGFPYLETEYQPTDKNMRLRGLNIAKVNDDYFINALQIFQFDELDERSKQSTLERGKKESKHVLAYLKAEFPGFENAEVKSYPSELYVRESRHIFAEYQLPLSDVWTNKDHWDGIGFGAYPVDVQAQVPNGKDTIYCNPNKYAIPFRSLIPLRIDGLLVVGRAAGYTSLAAGSARVVPTGMTTGEAAGVAAALANETDISFRELSKSKQLINKLRKRLTEQGAYVNHYQANYPYQGEWYDEAIQTLINYGLIQANYTNELDVDKMANRHTFIQILSDGIIRVAPEKYREYKDRLDEIHHKISTSSNGRITRDEAANYIAKLLFAKVEPNAWQILIKQGLINAELAGKLYNNRELKNKELFAINAAVIGFIMQKSQ